ncbi:Uncharacterised protein [Mycobacterium tuberculosis]|nr:Uncharacterised protein [Mycobacterium tuberculosis]
MVATRVGATLLGLGVLLTALAVVGVVCGCARTLTGAGGSRFTGGAAPLRADLLALGIDLFGRGLFPLGGRCLGTGRPVALVVLLSRPVNGWGAVGLSPDLLNRSDQFVLPHTRCSLHAGSISQRTQFGQHHGGQRAGRLVGVEVWGICGSGIRRLAVGTFASRNEVRIGHGFPFLPPLITSYGVLLQSAKSPSAPIIDFATVIAISGEYGEPRPQEELVAVLAARQYVCRCCDCWTAPRIARFLAGSKQTPATLRINRELLLSGSSEPPRQQSAR